MGAGAAEDLLASSAKELQKQAHEAGAATREDLKAMLNNLAEEAKKRLTALTNSTVESLGEWRSM